jgi:hypothetical protein
MISFAYRSRTEVVSIAVNREVWDSPLHEADNAVTTVAAYDLRANQQFLPNRQAE